MGIRKGIGVQSLPYVGLISALVLLVWLVAVGIGTAFIILAIFKGSIPVTQSAVGGFTLAMLGIAFIRAAVYLLAEANLLFQIVRERQYYRWTSSFSGVEPAKYAIVNDSRPLSYQYRSWWLAVLLMVTSTALLIAGIRFKAMFWTIVPSAAVLAETILRFGLELLWLRTRFRPVGKRLLLRWAPWLSISARQY